MRQCSMSNPLDEIVRAHKKGENRGITSICSAHPWVLKAAMRGDGTLLIESTCNQVNQFGGYTGMTPDSFVTYVNGQPAGCGITRPARGLSVKNCRKSLSRHRTGM